MKNKILISILCLSMLVISANTLNANAEDLQIQADKQEHNGETGITTLNGNVKVKFGNMTLKSPKARVNVDANQKPVEAEFYPNPSAIKTSPNSQSTIKADIIKLSLLENKIKAEGNTFSAVIRNKKPVVTIQADYQEYDKNESAMTARGKVNIVYDKIKTTSESAVIYVTDSGELKEVNLIGNAVLIQEKSIIKAKKLIYNPTTNEMVAIGTAYSKSTLDDGSVVQVWSDLQQYLKATNTMMAGGSVRIAYKDYLATGPKATFLPSKVTNKPNNIIFYGRSRIKETSRTVEADKIEITVTPKNFLAEGNVKTTFQQVSVDKKSKTTTKKKKKVIVDDSDI